MKEGSIFKLAYEQVSTELDDLSDKERSITLQNDAWNLKLVYFYKFNHLQLEFDIQSRNAAIEFPYFDLYKKPFKLFGWFTLGLDSGHLDGKMSDLSDHFCELKSTEFLLYQTDSHLGWKEGSIRYLAKLNEKQIEQMVHVFNCIEFTCIHSEPLLEVL